MTNVTESPLLKRFLVVSIYVCASSFYTLRIIPERARDMAEVAAIGLVLLLIIINALGAQENKIKQNYKYEIYLFLLSVFFSMFMANIFHGQSFQITFVAQRYMYFYFFYFFLHSLRITPDQIEKLIIPLTFFYIAIWVLQFVLHPTIIVDSRVDAARGTIRIFLPGGSIMVLAYYRSLQLFLKNNQTKHLMFCLLIFSVHGILQGTRQSLASIVLLTAAFVFFSKQVKSRAFVIFLGSLAALAVFILFQDILMNFLTLTQTQVGAEKENIRITSVRFFLNEFQPSNLTRIFGNGADSMNSSYGMLISFYRTLGLHRSDIGVLGDYSKFGVFFVLAQMIIMLRLIFGKLPQNLGYIKYYMVSRLLVSFSGSNMFGGAGGIVFLGLILYLIDHYKSMEGKEEKRDAESSPT